MFIKRIYKIFKNYYFNNLVNLHTSKEIHGFMVLEINYLCDLQYVLNQCIKHYSHVALNSNINLTSSEKVFLIMIQDFLSLIEERYSLERKAKFIVMDICAEYQKNYNTFLLFAEPVISKIQQNEIVSDFLVNCADEQTYYAGDVIKLVVGEISDLKKIDLVMFNTDFDQQNSKIVLKIKNYIETIDGAHMIYKEKESKIIVKIGKVVINIILNPDVYKTYLFTIDTIMIRVSDGWVFDELLAMNDLYDKKLNVTLKWYMEVDDAIVDNRFSHDATYNHILQKQLCENKIPRAQLNILHQQFISVDDVILFFKYSKLYDSKPKLKRFMKDTFNYKFNYGKFKDFNMLELIEYII